MLEIDIASEANNSSSGAPVLTKNESDPPTEPSTTKVDVGSDLRPNNAYRSSLDTTPRKIVVHNALKFLNRKQLDAMVQSWLDDAAKPGGFKLVIEKYKKPPRNGWINVTVAEDGMVESFINLINGTKRTNKRGQVLYARRAGEDSNSRRNDRTKRGRGDDDNNDRDGRSDIKRARPDVPAHPTSSQVRDKLTALWSQPYPSQLEHKKVDMIRKCAYKIIKELKSRFRAIDKEARRNPQRVRIKEFSWINEAPPIPIEDVVRSPEVTRYRNKCELTFGYRCPGKGQNGHPHKSTHADKNERETLSNKDEVMDESVEEESLTKTDGSTERNEDDSRIPALGFLPYGWRHAVASPHCLQNIPDEVCAVTNLIDGFLSDSLFPSYDTLNHRGLWRTVTIRSSKRTKQVMVIVVHASPEGGAGEGVAAASEESSSVEKEKRALFEKERDRMVSILTKDELPIPTRDLPSVQMARDKELEKDEEATTIGVKSERAKDISTEEEPGAFRVTSIYFQEYNGLSNPSVSHPVQHAYGSKFIEEKLGSNTYQISPGAFFQVTTSGAEVLYNVVADRIKETNNNPADTLMFDVCCGTGTIGLHCLTKGVVGRVVGVDISEPAIEDALENAKRNGFRETEESGKTRFVASRAELVMQKELHRVKSARDVPSSIVAIVDPARDGLHPDVIKAIRGAKEIQRLVYVSCNPTGSLVRDATILCGPATKKFRGLPFKPTRAQPVDMFPLTPHCEMVMTFDRMTAEEVEEKSESVDAKESSVESQEEKCKIKKEENSESLDAKESSVEPQEQKYQAKKEENTEGLDKKESVAEPWKEKSQNFIEENSFGAESTNF